MGVIVFNGVSSKDLGIEVETFPTYEVPQRELETIKVPGRNGDLVIDTGTYRNTTRTYKISMATHSQTSYYKMMGQIAEWLHSSSGYARLEDSYEPEYYRLAYFSDSLSIENLFDEAGRATIKFICKPQRYLKIGDYQLLFDSSGGYVSNPTRFIAAPLISIHKPDGTDVACDLDFLVDGNIKYKISLAANSGPVIIDSELQDAFNGSVNKNPYVTVRADGEFPKLEPGLTRIVFNEAKIEKVVVTPRWWTI